MNTALGDVWVLGEHRLICGDSTDAKVVQRLMGRERAILMATDPPYGVAYSGKTRQEAVNLHTGKEGETRWADSFDNEDMDGDGLQQFLEAVFRVAMDWALRENAAWYLWHAQMTQGFFAAAATRAARLLLSRQIVWNKPQLLLGFGDYHWKHELCFYGWVQGNRPPFYGSRNQTTVWDVSQDTAGPDKVHSTQKPTRLFEIPLLNHTRPGEVCFEPFAGSGSQIIAAERTGRRCFAIELSPEFCDAIVRRWAAFTGKEPRKL